MKITVQLIDDIPFITSRQIRNYIASISKDSEDKSVILSHNRTAPELIYPKPYRFSFTIIDCKDRIDLADRLSKRIIANPNFYNHRIKQVQISQYQYTIPAKQTVTNRYYTRTPVIVSSNDKEFGLFCAIKHHNDIERLKQAVSQRINYDIRYQLKCYFGIDYKTDIDINIEDIMQLLVKYKPDIIRSAVKIRFTSSYLLPKFVGYGIGLGWGQIVREKTFIEQYGYRKSYQRIISQKAGVR